MKILKQVLVLQQGKKTKGNYWDSFVKMVFDYDKRNQNFKQQMVLEVHIQ